MKDEASEDITEQEVMDIIDKLEDGKATGPDGISNEMIKRGGKSLNKVSSENDENSL